MHIGIAGPISFNQLDRLISSEQGPYPKGLGGTNVNNLILELWKRGHTLSIYSLDESIDSPKIYQGERIKIYLGPYRQKHRMRDIFRVERDFLLDAISKDSAPFVNAHWTYEFALPAIASGKPNLITCHDSPFRILLYQPTFYRLGRLMMALAVFKRGQHFSAVSPQLAKDIKPWISKPVEIIPNLVPEYLFKYPLKEIHNPPAKIVSIINGWGRLKNPETILKSFGLVKRIIPDIELVMYGYDFGPGEIANRWAKQHHLDQGVTFKGYAPYTQLHEELIQFDLLVHTSLEESFGMNIAEAIALGIPVIAGHKSGAIPWVLDGGNAGMLVDVNSPNAVAQAVINVLNNPTLANSLAKKGREKAISAFHPEIVASQYEFSYQQL